MNYFNFKDDFVILAGDFNLLQDPSLDYYNYNYTTTKTSITKTYKLFSFSIV